MYACVCVRSVCDVLNCQNALTEGEKKKMQEE